MSIGWQLELRLLRQAALLPAPPTAGCDQLLRGYRQFKSSGCKLGGSFIHIPKTAGSTVEAALRIGFQQHTTMRKRLDAQNGPHCKHADGAPFYTPPRRSTQCY